MPWAMGCRLLGFYCPGCFVSRGPSFAAWASLRYRTGVQVHAGRLAEQFCLAHDLGAGKAVLAESLG